ncbi:hypothetical protein ANTQUA_LOCUS2960 [Anthophora quadrimaculata]
MQQTATDSPNNIRLLSEQAQMHINALKALDQLIQHWDTILVYHISKRLDKNTRREWERTLEDEEIPRLEQLLTLSISAHAETTWNQNRYTNHD